MNIEDVKIGIDSIKNPTDIMKYLDGMRGLDHEIMYVFGFSNEAKILLAENIIRFSERSKGQFSQEDLFRRLEETCSKGFILVHNHPNGVCIPTETDVNTTKEVMKEAKKKKLLFIEHYTWTNGILWGIINTSIKKNLYIKNENIVRKK